MTLDEALNLKEGARVIDSQGKVWDFGYISISGKAMCYRIGEKDMQGAISLPPEEIRPYPDPSIAEKMEESLHPEPATKFKNLMELLNELATVSDPGSSCNLEVKIGKLSWSYHWIVD